MENYLANPQRYAGGMQYERCGRSGVLLPKVSLGFWHNFGGVVPFELPTGRQKRPWDD